MRINKKPIVLSVIVSLFMMACFYAINLGIDATESYGGVVSTHYPVLFWGKWLIIAGIIIKGVAASIVKE